MRGDHIIVNKNPPLRRPIVLVNVKDPSNIVRQNLVKSCIEIGLPQEVINELEEILKY